LALEVVQSKQRLVPGTFDVSYFDYDEWGYHFITTKNLCDVVRENCPEFAKDLAREAFGRHPAELFLNVIHPGGTRMIREVGKALELKGSLSEELATECMADGGNIASASVVDMIERTWKELENGNELICIGMGPGFVMCGAALKVLSS
jgi:predicted naringenin-chalcone synthase